MKGWNSMRVASFVCGFVLAVSLPVAWPSSNALAQPRGVIGVLDPLTGRFRAAPPPVSAAATTTLTGKFVYNITISVVSPLPAGAVIECYVSADVFDVVGLYVDSESTTVPATRSGSTAACSPAIPYSWTLISPASDSVSIGYSVSAQSLSLSRENLNGLPSIHVPANGSTYTATIKTIL